MWIFPTAISLGPPTGASFMPLTPFETLFILMLIIQVSVLQTTGIIPLNLNDLFAGNASGRKRKRRRRNVLLNSQNLETLQNIPSIILMRDLIRSLRKLDRFECIDLTFCVLNEMDTDNINMLLGITNSPKSSQTQCTDDLRTTEYPPGLFEAVLETLSRSGSNSNSSASVLGSASDYENDFVETLINTSTSGYSINNTQSHSPTTSMPRSNSELRAHGHRYDQSSSCDKIHKTCPISIQDLELYIRQLFELSNIY